MEWSGPCIKHLLGFFLFCFFLAPLFFCDLAERKEPADTKTNRKVTNKVKCISGKSFIFAWLVYIVILQIVILFTGMLHAERTTKKTTQVGVLVT